MYNVIVLGSGPAGLTAAIYMARANLQPLVIEGLNPGGQLTQTTVVENFPGFPEGVMGPDLMEAMRKQAEHFGAQFVSGDAMSVEFQQAPFKLNVENDTYEGKAVIVATGASAKMIGLESERLLLGRGVSTCATCDGFFFRGKKVVVVGGGDSALEEANFLTRFADHVTIVHRRNEFRASKVMRDRTMNNPKISVVWNAAVSEIMDIFQNKVTGIRLADVTTGKERVVYCDGVFVAIGHKPNTDLFLNQLDLTNGYITVTDRTRTSVPGIFVAGDVHDWQYRQAITAAASGCMAAIDCEKWLEANHQHA
jgi:thioredoxin reductase (NADPH)